MTSSDSPALPRRRDLRRAGLLVLEPTQGDGAPTGAGSAFMVGGRPLEVVPAAPTGPIAVAGSRQATGALPRRRDLRRAGRLSAISPLEAAGRRVPVPTVSAPAPAVSGPMDVTQLDTVGLDLADLAELDRLDSPGDLDDLTSWNRPAVHESVPPAVPADEFDTIDPLDLAALDLDSLDLTGFELDITGFTGGLPLGHEADLDPAFRFDTGDLFVPAEWQPGTFGFTAVETTAETVLLPRRRELREGLAGSRRRRRPRSLTELLLAVPVARTAKVGLAGGLAAATLFTVATQAPKLSHLLDDASAPATASLDVAATGRPAPAPVAQPAVTAVAATGPVLAAATLQEDDARTHVLHDRVDAQVAAQAAALARQRAAEAAAHARAVAKARAQAEAKARAAARARLAAERAAARARAVRDGVRDPRALGEAMAADRGWTGAEWTALDKLWTRESNWNYRAYNPSSGAYGIPQALPGSKMAAAGSDWHSNPATQIRWGLNYIADRYGDPLAAWAHSQRYGWY